MSVLSSIMNSLSSFCSCLMVDSFFLLQIYIYISTYAIETMNSQVKIMNYQAQKGYCTQIVKRKTRIIKCHFPQKRHSLPLEYKKRGHKGPLFLYRTQLSANYQPVVLSPAPAYTLLVTELQPFMLPIISGCGSRRE